MSSRNSKRKYSKTTKKFISQLSHMHLRQYFPSILVPYSPPKFDQIIVLHNLRPNALLFYFAASGKNLASKHPPSFKNAFGYLENGGIARTDATGTTVLHLMCPQLYVSEDGEIYKRHYHFVYWNSDEHTWSHRILVRSLMCYVSESFLHQHRSAHYYSLTKRIPEYITATYPIIISGNFTPTKFRRIYGDLTAAGFYNLFCYLESGTQN